MVQYSTFRDELKWYFEESDQKIMEVSNLFVGERDDYDNILEQVEQKYGYMNRTQELIGKASFVNREVRRYDEKNDSGYTQMAIYNPEGVKSSIIVAKIRSYSVMTGNTLFKVCPTTDVENKINDILYDDTEYELVRKDDE